jgi:CoA:oxalate CoA-transferase
MAGPFTTMILGDLGARVIKLEPPNGDPTRGYPPHFIDGDSAYFHSLNRNKESVAVDLRSAEGRARLVGLVRHVDVVVDNYRPAVLRRLGCDYESVRRIKPDIVSCSITGYGIASNRPDEPTYDLGVQASAGVMSLNGEPGGPPLRLGVPMGDLAGALYAVAAILAALFDRAQTGVGQRIEIGLVPSLASLHTYQILYYMASGLAPEPIGTTHTSIVPFQAFRTLDSYVCVMAPSEKFWVALCRAVAPRLETDRRFQSAASRLRNRDALARALTRIFGSETTAEWVLRLRTAGVPVAPVNNIAQALTEPEIADLLMSVERDGVPVPLFGSPIRMWGTPLSIYAAAPKLGSHRTLPGEGGSA